MNPEEPPPPPDESTLKELGDVVQTVVEDLTPPQKPPGRVLVPGNPRNRAYRRKLAAENRRSHKGKNL